MLLTLRGNDFLRLKRGAGTWIEVVSGRIWLTEPGGAQDRLLEPGRRYLLRSDELVLVGSHARDGDAACAEIAVMPVGGSTSWSPAGRWLGRYAAMAWGALASAIRAGRTRVELEGLSDHLLRDIGLRREQIASASRAPRRL